MALNDINCFDKVADLLATETEFLYEVCEKTNPSKRYTLKVFKQNEEIKRIIDLLEFLYLTNSDKPNSLGLQYFPKLVSDFKCWEKGTNQMDYSLVYEFVPMSLRNHLQAEKKAIPPFEKIYEFFRNFVNALSYLELNDRFHGRISPDVLGFSTEIGVKFMDIEKYSHGIGSLEDEDFHFLKITRYMAPELQIALSSRKKIKFNGNKVDVFATGVIILELAREEITEKLPLHDLEREIQSKIENFKEKYEKKVDPNNFEIFEKFVKYLEKCLKIDPVQRASSLELFKKSLKFTHKSNFNGFLKILAEKPSRFI